MLNNFRVNSKLFADFQAEALAVFSLHHLVLHLHSALIDSALNVKVLYAAKLLLHFLQLVKMRGAERIAFDLFS